jgi:hypothetical protein
MPPAPPVAPTLDLAAAYPSVSSTRAALAARDWPAIRASYSSLDWAGRALLVRAVKETNAVTPFLGEVVARDPADTLAATALAGRLIEEGWEIRTGARAQHVSREQFAAFHDHLRRAERLLVDATARDPDNVVAWTERLLTALGLGLGQAEARRRYDRLAAVDPRHLPAQAYLLQQLCPKWGGSFEKVHEFARECMLAAPPGAPNAVLVVSEHLERALELADNQGGSRTARFTAQLRRAEVRREVAEAAQRSVLHPDFRHEYDWVWVRNTFALAFSLGGEHAQAAAQFAALGPLASEFPWAYLGSPERAFAEHRARALKKGARS